MMDAEFFSPIYYVTSDGYRDCFGFRTNLLAGSEKKRVYEKEGATVGRRRHRKVLSRFHQWKVGRGDWIKISRRKIIRHIPSAMDWQEERIS